MAVQRRQQDLVLTLMGSTSQKQLKARIQQRLRDNTHSSGICMRLSIGKHQEVEGKGAGDHLHRSVISPEGQRRRVTRANQNRARNAPRN